MTAFKNQSFNRRLGFAVAGLLAGLRSEHSLRFQLIALIGVVVVLVAFHVEASWWALVALTSSAVIAVELLNTAVEHLVDHLHPQAHPRIRVVKDLAAAAVLVAACGALAVAIALFVHVYTRLVK